MLGVLTDDAVVVVCDDREEVATDGTVDTEDDKATVGLEVVLADEE